MICNSLYGQLTEKEDGSIRQYEATFIARAADHFEREGDAHSERLLNNDNPDQSLD